MKRLNYFIAISFCVLFFSACESFIADDIKIAPTSLKYISWLTLIAATMNFVISLSISDDATIDGIIYPSLDPSIFEVKFPNVDIEGRAVGNNIGTTTY